MSGARGNKEAVLVAPPWYSLTLAGLQGTDKETMRKYPRTLSKVMGSSQTQPAKPSIPLLTTW